MNYSFLIHSSVDGHLGCFRILAIVNSAAMNTGVHMTFSIIVSSGYMPSSGIVGSYDGVILSIQRNLHMFSIVAISIYIPTAVLEGSFFSKTSKWLFKRGHFPISTSLKLWTRGKKKKKLALGTKWLPLSKHTHAHTHTRGISVTEGLEHMDVYFSNEMGRHLIKVAMGVHEIIPCMSLPDRSPKGEPFEWGSQE